VPTGQRPLVSALALASAARRILDHVAAARGHDTGQRRYMWKVDY
jgi:fructoselysine-6-P-deglycase FrlB-like protein